MPHSAPSRVRLIATGFLTVVALFTTACAAPQTNIPYTPAAGVNTDLSGMKVRNLVIVEKDGSGALSGALLSATDDTLTSIAGAADKADGTTLSQPTSQPVGLAVPANRLVKLDAATAPITYQGLTAGMTATVRLTFARAGTVQLTVPVLSGDHADFSAAAPSPTAGS